MGPDAQRPALSADGSTLYWIELETGDPATLEVTAVLHAMDVATGEEAPTIDIDLGTSEIRIHADLTISGSDQLLLTRWFDGGLDEHGQVTQTWQPPLVIDPATGDVQPVGRPGADWHFAG